MIAAPAKSVEILRFEPHSPRGAAMFEALGWAAADAGSSVTVTTKYDGRSSWLMLWGPGAPNRFEPMRAQLAAGGHVIAWDLAYWSRESKVRVSIDGAHPQAWVMRKRWPHDRFDADPVTVENAWDPDGPVIVAGIGEKATAQYGADVVKTWETEQARAAEAAGYRVIYRPKKPIVTPIETALRGAAAVNTYHSNVAVDAIRLGIPVVCRDGAAAAACSPSWHDTLRPLPLAWREGFLSNLAWFQWAPSEAAACWRFLTELLS